MFSQIHESFLEHLKPHACFSSTTLPSDQNTLVLVVISHGSISNISNSKSVLKKQQWFKSCASFALKIDKRFTAGAWLLKKWVMGPQINPDRWWCCHDQAWTQSKHGQRSPKGTMEQSTWLVLNCVLPFPGEGLVRVNLLSHHSVWASNASVVGLGSIIIQSTWLAFFDSEHCSKRYEDEFGLEFN